jgi:hypothetical protein
VANPLSGGEAPFQTLSQVIHSSHWPQLERPEEFNTALRSWLKRLPPVGSVNYTSEATEEAVGKEKEEEHRHPDGRLAAGKIVDLDEKRGEKAQSRGGGHEEL